MKERPILFNSEMVRAVLDGRKSQTRRVVKNPDELGCLSGDCPHEKQTECDTAILGHCPYGKPGDQLWVRETWAECATDQSLWTTVYRADESARLTLVDFDEEPLGIGAETKFRKPLRWKPSIHMSRWASRIQLEITAVRVERVQDISGSDALAEGISTKATGMGPTPTPIGRFHRLWDSINKSRGYGWGENPWVWCVEFQRLGGTA